MLLRRMRHGDVLPRGAHAADFCGSAHAQKGQRAGAVTLRAVDDSQAVLRELDSRVRAHPNDTTAWYRQGMVAWFLAHRGPGAVEQAELGATKPRPTFFLNDTATT